MSGYRPSRPSQVYGPGPSFSETRYQSTKSGLPERLSGDAYARIEARLRQIKASRQPPEPGPQVEVQPVRKMASAAPVSSVRVASLKEIPRDFKALGGGFYRQGHVIWELRGAEDEEGGYVLTRKREERAVDLRGRSAARTASAKDPECSVNTADKVVFGKCPSCLWVGQRVAFIKGGQVLPVIIIEMPADGDTSAKVEDEAGQQMRAPLDMIVTDMTVKAPPISAPEPVVQSVPLQTMPMPMPMPEQVATPKLPVMSTAPAGCDCQSGCPCPCHNGKGVKKGPVEGMTPRVEPSSKDKDAQPSDSEEEEEEEEELESSSREAAIRRAWLIRGADAASGFHAKLWDRLVSPKKRFSPQYMGGTFTFDPDDREIYTVVGMSKADPEYDRLYGVPHPILPYPNARRGPEWVLNDRVRLKPFGGGDYVFVSPMELERNFEVMPETTQPDTMSLPKSTEEPKLPEPSTKEEEDKDLGAPATMPGRVTVPAGPRRRAI